MRVLVTGGAGFIGSHTVDALIESGHEVRILDNLQVPVHLKGKPPWLNQEAEFILGDVRNKADWEKALHKIDAVFHLAAYQDYLPDFSTFLHVNSVSTSLLYEVVVEKKMDISKVIVASSQFVQGEGLYQCNNCNEQTGPLMRTEKQLIKGEWEHRCTKCSGTLEWKWTGECYTSPPNAYAMAKHSQELQAITFGRRYNIPSVALRYSIVQGPRQSFYNAYSGACRIFCLHYYFEKSPTIYEDGEQRRDFVNIHDVVRANLLSLNDNRMNYEVFNVGGSEAYSIFNFSEIVRHEMERNKSKKLPKAEVPGLYRFGDTRNACSDINKIRAFGWEPECTPVDSVREYVEWLYLQDNVKDILDYANNEMKRLNVVRSISK
jgi:dTDP-L-rhamnose 4-epimerase